jgi:hypothetical protein
VPPLAVNRMGRMKINLLIPILFLLLSHAPCVSAQSRGIIPAAGQPLPEIRLPRLDGSVMTMSELIGKRTVLHVFASW